ncbi:Ribonuclease, partial [Quillaja saponaria]
SFTTLISNGAFQNNPCHFLILPSYTSESLQSGTFNNSERYQRVTSYYKLALQWPKSYCSTQPRQLRQPCLEPQQFTIHGLWPVDSNDISITCYGNNVPPLPPLGTVRTCPFYNDLVNSWPNLKNGQDNYSFWKHEWTKHGVCSRLKPNKYFEFAIMAYKSLPPLLEKLHPTIRPGHNYSLNLLHAESSKIYQKSVEINCNNRGAQHQFFEVFICFHLRGSISKCPRSFAPTCTGVPNALVLFPN